MATLDSTTSSLLTLLIQSESSVTRSPLPSSIASASENNVDLLSAVEQSASLIKAQTTKLSLLCITEPFTPSAVLSVLRELSTAALPVLMSAVQSCSIAIWGQTFTNELNFRTQRLLQELKALLEEISLKEKGDSSKKVTGGGSTKDRLQSTGVIWEVCDELIELKNKGIAGVVATKAQEYQDMLEDAITELREWGDEVDKDEDDDDEGSDGAKDDGNFFLKPQKGLSKKDTDLKSQLDKTLKRLEFVKMLYKPLIKRRLRTFPVPAPAPTMINGGDTGSSTPRAPECIATLESLMHNLKIIQEQTDELASAFYDHNSEQASELLEQCVTLAKESALAAELNWKGEKDELSPWLEKWKHVIDK